MTSQFSHRIGIVAWFQINQTQIIELFCINKEKPELACDGKCYLKQKLIESEKHTNEQSSNILTSLKYEITILIKMVNYIFIDAPFVSKIFAPPRCI